MTAATTAAPVKQVPGVYHRRIGDIVVTAISDGHLDGGLEVLRNIPEPEAQAMFTAAFRPGRRTQVNAFLIHSAGRLALVDTGSGDHLGPTAGWMFRNLAAAGVDLARIEKVLLTHMHPDHSAGLSDPKTGARFFPNAELAVNENEPRHWSDDGAMARASERHKLMYFQLGRAQTAPYRDRMVPVTDREVFPGVTAVPLHGHTPGHTGYLVSSGKESLLIWGDIVHVPEIQPQRPEVCMEFDTDAQAAAAMRRKTFDMVATDRLLVAGMHLHFPAFCHLERRGGAYAIVPEPWSNAM
jgi:glyoxylase-like metal-dependent hydrolase (beta-lactamase superfamily II)